ncbi:MAG TPA: ArsR family transcriptional regulator [Phycisphaerae bacterium]|nr:ArsR family transcriptional regulator [Phycisphaerae bacterium]
MKNESSPTKLISRKQADGEWLERIVKGFGNRRRIQILRLLKAEPELSLSDICDRLNMIIQNGSEHMRKLVAAGLVTKRRQCYCFRHKITERGLYALHFLDTVV